MPMQPGDSGRRDGMTCVQRISYSQRVLLDWHSPPDYIPVPEHIKTALSLYTEIEMPIVCMFNHFDV